MRHNFTCCICEETYPSSELSHESYQKSGEDTRNDAVLYSDPDSLVCRGCEADLADERETSNDGELYARTDTEAFEFSGIEIDPARLQAYRLSY